MSDKVTPAHYQDESWPSAIWAVTWRGAVVWGLCWACDSWWPLVLLLFVGVIGHVSSHDDGVSI